MGNADRRERKIFQVVTRFTEVCGVYLLNIFIFFEALITGLPSRGAISFRNGRNRLIVSRLYLYREALKFSQLGKYNSLVGEFIFLREEK